VIDPGEWPRGAAVSAAGRAAAPLLALVVPALALVALVESSVSPAPGIPGWAKGILGLGLAGALWAFLLAPGRDR
jgi:hypothetical protein